MNIGKEVNLWLRKMLIAKFQLINNQELVFVFFCRSAEAGFKYQSPDGEREKNYVYK